jgi:acetyl esterase/lipase
MKNLLSFFLLFIAGFAIAQPGKKLNILYCSQNCTEYDSVRHLLDIYTPEKKDKKTTVVVFIHGGKWKVGNKDLYRFLGKKFTKHAITAVIINYRLSPTAQDYTTMAMDCAHAVKWVYEHIEEYGGDQNKIYLLGHSSGGHLSALIASNNRFFDSVGISNPVKGCILMDPFGLTIDSYLQAPPKKDQWMYNIFTKNKEVWKDAACVNYIKEDSLKFSIYNGFNSPSKIKKDSNLFYEAAAGKMTEIRHTTLYNVGHLGILFQLYYTKHPLYNEFLDFMKP